MAVRVRFRDGTIAEYAGRDVRVLEGDRGLEPWLKDRAAAYQQTEYLPDIAEGVAEEGIKFMGGGEILSVESPPGYVPGRIY